MTDDFNFLLMETSDAVQQANRTIMALQMIVAHMLGEFELPMDYLVNFRQILDHQVSEGLCPPSFADSVMSEIERMVAISRELRGG